MPPTNPDSATADLDMALLMGLAVACPVGQDNPADCPLHEVRDLPLIQRVAWVKARTQDEVKNILSYHRTCCPRYRQ